ncbi:MAG: CPBP family intramembrane metalloprotease [Cyclobacteriaceae bacterium]|nr:CPBP family intramembrane metalloprotease [Cyclobacteriaceae bacterium]
MSKFRIRIKEHVREDYQPQYYLSLIILISAALLLNFSISLENKVIDQYNGTPVRIFLYLALYSILYYLSCLFISIFKHEWNFWNSKKYWLLSLFGLFIMSLDRGFPYLHQLANAFDQPFEVYRWIYRVCNHALAFFLVCLPLFLFYKFIDKSPSYFYGLTRSSEVKPYLILLVIALPLLVLASLFPSFTSYYPIYKSNDVSTLLDWPSILPMIIFEFFYGADFLNVELLFRGFFVIGLSQVLGRNSIMPMVVIYCALHFGKPVGEAISSIFGGYILGIIAYSTRSIWGGILIHMGIAWLMELTAYVSKQL